MKTIKFWPKALKMEPSLARLVVGNFKHQLQLAREIVHQLEVAQGGRQLSQLEIWLLHSLKKQSLALSSLLRTVARIRSRIDWLKSGYANMNLFHMHSRYLQKKNFIAKLQKEGQVVTAHNEKAEVLWDFYSGLIGSREERNFFLLTLKIWAYSNTISAPLMLQSLRKRCIILPNSYLMTKLLDQMGSRNTSTRLVGM
jgi:hypothetical protein